MAVVSVYAEGATSTYVKPHGVTSSIAASRVNLLSLTFEDERAADEDATPPAQNDEQSAERTPEPSPLRLLVPLVVREAKRQRIPVVALAGVEEALPAEMPTIYTYAIRAARRAEEAVLLGLVDDGEDVGEDG